MRSFAAGLNFLLLIGVSGCLFQDENIGSDENQGFFPMKVGSKWTYSKEVRRYDYSEPDINNPDSIYNYSIEIEVKGTETLQDSIKSYHFHEKSADSENSVVETDSYYYNSPQDGIFMVASSSGSFEFSDIIGTSNLFSSYSDIDSIKYNVIWPMCLKYPLEVGSWWIYESTYSSSMIREVEGIEEVSVPAGTFECYKIKTTRSYTDADYSKTQTDYICSQGLIKRHIVIDYSGDWSFPVWDIDINIQLTGYLLK